MLDVTKAHPLRPTTLAHRVSNIRLSTLHRISEPAFNDCPSTNLIRAFYTLAAGCQGRRRRAGSSCCIHSRLIRQRVNRAATTVSA